MSPETTLRFRQTTAALAAGWALLSLVFSIVGNVLSPPETRTPVQFSSVTGTPVVTLVSPQAREAGVAQERGLDSLNVAAAGAVLMARWYERTR